jgi:hypothetical protein
MCHSIAHMLPRVDLTSKCVSHMCCRVECPLLCILSSSGSPCYCQSSMVVHFIRAFTTGEWSSRFDKWLTSAGHHQQLCLFQVFCSKFFLLFFCSFVCFFQLCLCCLCSLLLDPVWFLAIFYLQQSFYCGCYLFQLRTHNRAILPL